MLVVSRKINEQIQIGDDITVTVVEVKRGRVRLGITAPKDVSIRRSELEFRRLPTTSEAADQHCSQATCIV